MAKYILIYFILKIIYLFGLKYIEFSLKKTIILLFKNFIMRI